MVVWAELGNTAAGILRKGIILVYGEVTGAVLLGAVIGSFLNVCIHRLPLRESLLWPRSRCPRCAKTIACMIIFRFSATSGSGAGVGPAAPAFPGATLWFKSLTPPVMD